MKELQKEVDAVMSNELRRASQKFGDYYASVHEAYGVIAEEFHEAKMEFERCEMRMTYLLCGLRHAEKRESDETWEHIAELATLGACELIQVAAVAVKAQRGFNNAD